MAITVEEKAIGRSVTEGTSPGRTLKYIIRGTDDDTLAKAALKAGSLATYDGLYRKTWGVEQTGPYIFEGTVTYGIRSNTWDQRNSDELPPTVKSFETIGGTQHINQSLATLNIYPAPGHTATDFKGAIGVTKDGIKGCDIIQPVHEFSETHFFYDEDVDFAYIRDLRDLTGHVNSATFRGFAPYEVLFLGASGVLRNEDQWEISFKFASQYNNLIEAGTDLTVGDITGIEKNAWDHLWIFYETEKDTASNSLIDVPKAVYIEKVYFWGNFDLLGID